MFSKHFKENRILKLPDLHSQLSCTYFYKAKHLNFDNDLFIKSNRSITTHYYFTRNPKFIHTPLFCRLNSQNSFYYKGTKFYKVDNKK